MDIVTPSEKKKVFDLFSNLKEEMKKASESGISSVLKKEVLLIDGTNTFIRAWAANPALNDNGTHSGGVSGFLKSIGYAIKLIQPDRCVVVFDGPGGSLKRKQLFSEYKNKRQTKIRLNRIYEENHLDLANEDQSLKRQLYRTIEYLQTLPVNILSLDNVEADDTIAYCSNFFKDNFIVNIMSSDKDFLQLANGNVRIWSPSKKKLYSIPEVLSEYGIHPYNFAIYRAMDGDVSDNIPGIPGCGNKTIIKAFPFLSEQRKISFNDIYKHCENQNGKLKIYEKVLENKQLFERNYELMQLYETQLSTRSQVYIMDVLCGKIPLLNKIEFSKLITDDRMWNNIPGYQLWLKEVFSKLNNFIHP